MKKLFENPIFKNMIWGTGGNVVLVAVSFVTSIVVLRMLGPSEFGLLQEMIAYFLILQNFENIINPNLLKKKIIENFNEANDYVISYGLVVFVIGVLLIAISAFTVWAFNLPDKYWLLVILLLSQVFRISNGVAYYFDAKLETIKTQISLNVGNLFSSGFKITMSLLRPTALAQVFSMPIQYLSTAVVHFYQYKSDQPNFLKFKFPKIGMKLIAIASFPLFLSLFVDLFRMRIPFIYLGATMGEADVGYFSAGLKLIEPWLFLVSPLGISFWPKIVKAKRDSLQVQREAYQVFFGVHVVTFLMIGLGGWVLSDFLIHYVLGAQYADSYTVFRIQCLTLVFQALNAAIVLAETNEGLGRVSLLRNGLSLGLLIPLMLYLTPLYGINGAALSILLSSAFGCLIVPLFFKRTRPFVMDIIKSPIKGPLLVKEYLKK